MTRTSFGILLLTFVTLIGASAQTSSGNTGKNDESPTRWYIRFGVAGVIYHPDATVNAGGSPVPGASVHVSNNVTGTLDIGYYLLPNITVSLLGGVPPKPKLSGAGTIEPYGELTSVWYAPAVLSAQYHFFERKRLQPYLGPGVSYAIILRKHASVLENIQVHNAFAPTLQVGAEYKLNWRWGCYTDLKQIWLSTDAHGKLGGVVPANARVKLYPTVLSAGFRYRF